MRGYQDTIGILVASCEMKCNLVRYRADSCGILLYGSVIELIYCYMACNAPGPPTSSDVIAAGTASTLTVLGHRSELSLQVSFRVFVFSIFYIPLPRHIVEPLYYFIVTVLSNVQNVQNMSKYVKVTAIFTAICAIPLQYLHNMSYCLGGKVAPDQGEIGLSSTHTDTNTQHRQTDREASPNSS